MRKLLPLLLILLISASISISCSGKNADPIIPQSGDNPPVQTSSETPLTGQSTLPGAQTHVWGYFNIFIDTQTRTVEVIPDRTAMFEVNVVNFLNGKPPKLGLEIINIDNMADYIDVDVDVTLTHPFPGLNIYNGYDVRGIFIGNGSNALDYNTDLLYAVDGIDQTMMDDPYNGDGGGPDGYTRWFNPSEFTKKGLFGYTPGDAATKNYTATATINPYKLFADGLAANASAYNFVGTGSGPGNNVFRAGSSNTRNYYIRFPMPNPKVVFNYAVLASWKSEAPSDHPCNAPEVVAYTADTSQSTLYYINGSTKGGRLRMELGLAGCGPQPDNLILDSVIFDNPQVLDAPAFYNNPGGETYSTYFIDLEAANMFESGGTDLWIIAQYDDFDYSNDYSVPNSASGDLLAAFFRVNVNVFDYIPPWIEIIYPNGGEQFMPGSIEQIRWTSFGVTSTVKIEYSKDKFKNDIQQIANFEPNDGIYDWTVPYDPSDTIRFRVSSDVNPSINDVSNGDSRIPQSIIRILQPNGGEQLIPGTDALIEWLSFGVSGNVRIDYSKDNFISDVNVIAPSIPNTGSYPWSNIPLDPSNTLRVRVASLNALDIFDVSDDYFSIAQPLIQVKSPNGGEQLQPGLDFVISWSSNFLIGNVAILYSKDNFVSDFNLITPNHPNNGTYTWSNIPLDPSNTVKVAVRSIQYPTIMDTSDDYFSILQPAITVTSPNGGEQWLPGSTQDIKWTSFALIGQVNIFYSKDNFTSNSQVISLNEPNDGSFTWSNIPFDPSTTVHVKVSSVVYPSVYDTSNAFFTIIRPTVTITSPNGGEQWPNGSNQTITWISSNLGGTLTIQYSSDNFISDILTLAVNEPNDGSYIWPVIPCFFSDTMKIRITSQLWPLVSDTSDNNFSITRPGNVEVWGDIERNEGWVIVADKSDNYYVTGVTNTPLGSSNVLFAKYDACDKLLWSKTWGDNGYDYGNGIALDSFGNVYVVGGFSGTVDFRPGSGFDFKTSAGDIDAFMSKFDSSGNYQWVRTWGGTGTEGAYGIIIDSSNNIYVSGDFQFTADFDPGPLAIPRTSNGGYDCYLDKFDSNGNYVWVKVWGGAQNDYCYGLAIDSNSYLYMSGNFYGTVDFDPSGSVDNYTSVGGQDCYLFSLHTSGIYRWTRPWGSAFTEGAHRVAVDPQNRVYVTGYFYGTVDFDPTAGWTYRTSNGAYDTYVVQYTSMGVFNWVQSWGGAGNDLGVGVCADKSSNVFISGRFELTADFDPTSGFDNRTSVGGEDAFINTLTSSGNFRWARTFGGSGSERGFDIACNSVGNPLFIGYYENTVNFATTGSPCFDPSKLHTSAGGRDVFLVRYQPDGCW